MKIFSPKKQNLANAVIWNNNKSLYPIEKDSQDIMDEKSFAWLELPDNFSTSSNKRSYTKDSLSDFDNTSIAIAKTANFLSNIER